MLFIAAFMFVIVACKEQPKPEQLEKTPTMEEALKQAQDPNDYTQKPLVGELISMDLAAQGNNTPLADPATVTKMAKDGAFIVFKAGEAYYIVLNKNDYNYNIEPLAQFAGKKIALYGMVKPVSGINFFLMEKVEEAK